MDEHYAALTIPVADRADRFVFPYHRQLAEQGRRIDMPAFTWPSVERQRLSHDAVLQFYLNGSVLDIGCGTGELSERVQGRYVGIDLEPAFIQQARRNYPRRKFRCERGLEKIAPGERFDYVVAIGPFCYAQGGSHDEDMANLGALLIGMYERSRVAVLATIASSWATAPFQAERPHLRFCDPSFWLNYASQLSRRVLLKHDYVASEFVLAIFKEGADWPGRQSTDHPATIRGLVE